MATSSAPAKSTEERPTTRRPRWWKPLALALIVLVLLALAAAAVGYFSLRSYMPIHLAGSDVPGPGSLETRVVQNLNARTKYVVSGESSSRFGIVFDIKNTGRLPVKIEGLGGDAGSDSLVPRLQLHRARELTENRYYDFQPFTLESGETAFLGLEVIATNPCDAYVPGSSITWNSVSLRYSYARVFERGDDDPAARSDVSLLLSLRRNDGVAGPSTR